MRYVYPAAATGVVLAFFIMAGHGGSSNLSVTNYQLVSEERVTRTEWYFTYRADLVNPGQGRASMTASVKSLISTAKIVPGQGMLHFAPVPSNGAVTSSDTFTVMVDRNFPFSMSDLEWSFLSPTANAGAFQTATVGSTVVLNGSASSDPGLAGPLTYLWSFKSRAAGSQAVLSNPASVMPSFVVDAPGPYIASLTVSNGAGSDTATVVVSTINSPPVAAAGANQTVAVGASVVLNGSKSSDVDGDPLTHKWTLITRPAGSVAAIQNAQAVVTSFVADKAGAYVAQLVVNDGKADSIASTTTITTQNAPPVANPGPNQVSVAGSIIQLNGAGSTDVDGDALTYIWSLNTKPAGSSAALSSPAIVNPTFSADAVGIYVAQLIVNDGKVDSAPATVTITTNAMQAPTANAGPNQTVVHGTTVKLNGSGNDPQGKPLTYLWSLTTRPPSSTATLSDTTISAPGFLADQPGTYVAQLIVSNGTLSSVPATVTITTTNTPPVASAGAAQTVVVGATVALDGSASSDADSDPITFVWSIMSRPASSAAVVTSPLSKTPTLTVDAPGTYVVQLIVNDGFTNSAPVTTTITVNTMAILLTPNPLNLANAPKLLHIALGAPAGAGGQAVTLTGFDPTIIACSSGVVVPQGATSIDVTVTPLASGSTLILALAAGFQAGSATVNVVTPAITISLASSAVGLTKSITGTVTLSSPAPAAGATVALAASPGGFVSLNPVSVTVPPGGTTGAFSVTGLNEGSATITGSSAGYINGSATVTVTKLGAIVMPTPLTLMPGESAGLTVALATPAPQGGATIQLVSSDVTKATVEPQVFIAQGQVSPDLPPQVNAISFGSATITASAPGFVGANQLVKVGGALSFTSPTITVGAGGTQNVTLLLTAPAPTVGLTVTLTSTNPQVASAPPQVTIGAGQKSVTFLLTALAPGSSTLTAASSLPTITGATASISVLVFGAIDIPSNAAVALGGSSPFPVTLSSQAPAGGVVVKLSTSDSTKVGLSSPSVFIDAGQTQPVVQPEVTGTNLGQATITATAAGFGSTSAPVKTTAALGFPQPSTTLTGKETKSLTLTLSSAAPAGGLQVNLSANPAGLVTIPASVQILEGATSAAVSVTSVAAGATTITASTPVANVASATTSVTVQNSGSVNLQAGDTVAIGQSIAMAVTLSSAPPADTVVALSSSDSTKLSVSPSSVTIPAGQTQPASQPQVTGKALGTATIQASAPFYSPATRSVQITASIGLSPQNLTITGTETQNLTLTLGAPAPAGGLTFTVASSNTAVATLTSATVTIPENFTTATIPVKGVAPGSAVVTASAPNITSATANITVTAPIDLIVPANLTVAPNQSVPFTVSLAKSQPNIIFVTLSSSDATTAAPSLTNILIPAGSLQSSQPIVINGLKAGSATITASAPGLVSATSTVLVTGTMTLSPANLTLTGIGAQKFVTVTLSSPAPAGGVVVTLSSSNPSVATAPAQPITILANSTSASAPIKSVAVGTAVIHATSPGLPEVTSNVTVEPSGGITIAAASPIALGNSTPLSVTLSSPAPAGGVTVNLTTTDAAKVSVSPASVVIPEGGTNSSAFTLSALNVGSATINATALNYAPSNALAISVNATLAWIPNTLSIGGIGKVGQLNLALSGTLQFQAGVLVNLSSSNPAVATVQSSVNIWSDGSTQGIVIIPIASVGQGTAVIHASGINIPDVTATVTVTGPPVISTGSLPEGKLNLDYSATMAATGGTSPLTWSATGLPANLLMNTAGTINGKPAAVGVSSVVISVADSSTPPQTATKTLSLNVVAGATPATITVFDGSNQTAQINTAFTKVLKVAVKDASSNPVSGVTVTFTPPASGAGGTFAGGNTAVTDAIGIATSSVFTANGTAGAYSVIASVSGVNPSASFSLTNSVGPPASITVLDGSGQSAAVNSVFPNRMRAVVKDSGGNPVSGVSVTFAKPASGASGSFPGSPAVSTDGSGIATAPEFTANAVAGSYSVTASVAGLQNPATFTMTNTVGTAAALTATDGMSQSAPINTAFAKVLKVLVKDSANNPVSGVTVTFTSPASGASGAFAGGNTAVSDASGVAASSQFIANTVVGVYSVTASAPGATPASFQLTNTAGTPASIIVSDGSGQSAAINTAFAKQLKVIVKDAANNLVSGAVVTFSAPATGASGAFAAGNTAVTDAQGVATSSTFTANANVGVYSVTASVPGAPTPATFQLTNTAGAAASIAVFDGSGQTAPTNTAFAKPLKALVRDAASNPVAGVTVTFTPPASGASGSFAGGLKTAVTDASGIATSAVFTANGFAGAYAVAASVPNVAAAASFSLTNSAGAPASITATDGSIQNATINTVFTKVLKVLVRDAASNPVGGVTVTFSLPATGASGVFGGAAAVVTDALGVASSPVITANAIVGTFSATASVAGVSPSATFLLTNVAGPAAVISVSDGTGQTAPINSAFAKALKVLVKDASSNPVIGATVTFSAPASGASGTFAGGINTAVTDAAGIATSGVFTANGAVGSYNVSATVPNVAGAVSFALTNSAGAPASIAAFDGSDQSAMINTAFTKPLKAIVKDAGSNPVSGVTVTFSAPAPTGASGSFAGGVLTATTDAAGIATSPAFTANGIVGVYVVGASTPNVSPSTAFNLTNTAGPAASMTFLGGSPQTATVNTLFSNTLRVVVKDAAGNNVKGVTVTFTPPASGASGTFAGVNTAVTDVDGVATSLAFSANTVAGAYFVIASSTGLSPVNFSMTNVAGAAATISGAGGSGQSAESGAAFANPLKALVKDAFGNPKVGAPVTFAAPAAGPSGTFAGGTNIFTTDVLGIATTTTFTANGTIGVYNVTAAVANLAATATFSMTNTTPASGGGILTLSSPAIGKNLQAPISIHLSPPAPAGTNLTLTSSNPALALLGSAGNPGTGSVSALLSEGSTEVSTFVKALAGSGSVTITATAPGYANATATIVLAPSGFVVAGSQGIGGNFSTYQGVTTMLTVYAARLNASGGFVESQQVRSGYDVVVPVTSSPATIGTISGSPVAFPGGVANANAQFIAGTSFTGAATITVLAPNADFATPTTGATLVATVQQSGIVPFTATVGKSLQVPAFVTLTGLTAADVEMKVRSNDSSKLKFSTTPGGTGLAEITLTIQANRTASPEFYVQGFASSGSVGYTVDIVSFGSANGAVSLAPSGFVIKSVNGIGVGFIAVAGTGNPTIEVLSARLAADGAFIEQQMLAGGLTASVQLAVASAAIGSVSPATVAVSGGTFGGTSNFQPTGVSGSTTISATAPNFTTSSAGTVGVVVQTAVMMISGDMMVGKSLQLEGEVFRTVALPSDLVVTLTSSNPALMKLAALATAAGTTSITVTIPAGQLSARYYVQGVADSGTATYSASAPGFPTQSSSVTLAPSGVVMSSPGFAFLLFGPSPVKIATAMLNPGTFTRIEDQQLAGGNAPVVVNLANSNPSVGTLTPQATIPAGASSFDAAFTPLAVGTSTMSIVAQPPGWSTPAAALTSISMLVLE